MLFLVLGAQPFLWDGPLSPHDGQPAPDNVVFSVLNNAVEYAGGLMIATALALLLATGIGNRWFAAGRGIARLTSITAIASAACIKLMGLSMVLLSSGDDPISWLLLAAFIVIPLSCTAAHARRTLALC
jgi:hypothetical protein